MGRPRLITREETLADLHRFRAEGLSLRQIERKMQLAKSTLYDALHPDRAQAARAAKVKASRLSQPTERTTFPQVRFCGRVKTR
jgi:lambda repressor-like predicted transcriptional regulator